jgi:hypothetical protein
MAGLFLCFDILSLAKLFTEQVFQFPYCTESVYNPQHHFYFKINLTRPPSFPCVIPKILKIFQEEKAKHFFFKEAICQVVKCWKLSLLGTRRASFSC